MKMTYLSPTKRKKQEFFLVKGLALFFFILAVGFFLKNPLERGFANASLALPDIKNYPFLLWFKDRGDIISESIELKNKIVELEAIAADKALLTEENNELRTLLEFKKLNENYAAGVVVSKSEGTPNGLLKAKVLSERVEVGSKVKRNDLVIGEVVEKNDNLILISLYSYPGKSTKAFFGKEKIEVEARGLGGGVFEVFIPKAYPAKLQDALILPDISPNFLGSVQSVQSSPEETFQRILVGLPTNPESFTYLLIEEK